MTMRDLEWFQTENVREPNDSGELTKDDTKGKADEKATKGKAHEKDTKKLVAATGMSPGAIGAILNEDVALVAQSLTGSVANFIRSFCSLTFATYNMFQLNPALFGVSFGVVPVVGVAAMLLRRFIRKVAIKQRETAILAASFAEEKLTHIAMVKMSNRELDEVEQFCQLQDEYVRLGRRVSLANGSFMGFIFAASAGALFVVFDVGGKAVAAGRMSPGQLTSFATYTFLLGLGTTGVVRSLGAMTQGLASAARVYRLIGDREEEKKTTKDSLIVPGDVNANSINSISLNDVEFAYKSNLDAQVLKGVSLTLKRGKVTCVVGKNGSGKTTIASLLAALYKPQSGSISLSDGTNYNELDRETQTNLVQVVPQSPAIFNTSILENVRYCIPSASQEETLKAMDLANCGFVAELDGGVNYQVGPNGGKLSGGQRQRLGIARALLLDPCILVLDEPTSALDHEGETAVADAVKACRGSPGRALLLITHRAKSLELADEVIVLKEGCVVEKGSFEDLRKKKDSALCELMPDLL
jgi:ABC-type multidrug transport system fused ATPase/permease subunit